MMLTRCLAFAALALSAITSQAAPVCNSTTDDTPQVQAYALAGTPLPAGTCRITADIFRTASAGYSPGLTIIGDPAGTTLLADYSNGSVIRLDQSGQGNYTVGTTIRNVRIAQAAGRTGLTGIQLTAAWLVKLDNVKVDGLSVDCIAAPLRPDINPISDFYQDFSVSIERSWFTGCGGWGINFGAGQSPGIYRIQGSIIANNSLGGIRTTTGQYEIAGNLIVANGCGGTEGGLWNDTAEGPSMQSDIRQNEFDTNCNYHLKDHRIRNGRRIQNRFLSSTYASPAGGSPVSGGAYMRPPVHVVVGDGSAREVWRTLYEQNLHRSVTGPSATSGQVIGYQGSAGALNQNRFLYNDFGPLSSGHADGTTQNSSGLITYCGFAGTDTIVAGDGLSAASSPACPPPPAPPPPPEPGEIVKARITVAGQAVYGTTTVVSYDVEDNDPGGSFAPLYSVFTAPSAGTYIIDLQFALSGLSSGASVALILWDTGTQSVLQSQQFTASGTAGQAFLMSKTIALSAGQRVQMAVTTPAPTHTIDVTDPQKNYVRISH